MRNEEWGVRGSEFETGERRRSNSEPRTHNSELPLFLPPVAAVMSLVWSVSEILFRRVGFLPLLTAAPAVKKDVERYHSDDPEHDSDQYNEKHQHDACLCHGCFSLHQWSGCLVTRTIHECRCEAFETNVRRRFSQVRLAWAYLQSVEEVPNVKRPVGERFERLATAAMNYSNTEQATCLI